MAAAPTLDDLQSGAGTPGGKAAVARALAMIEATPGDDGVIALLDAASSDTARAPACQVVGLTGPPGVGKSTLLNLMIAAWRGAGKTVGVIAVDPSSATTGGALLGDRTRLMADPEDAGLFFRSMAARDHLGGLATLTVPALLLMRALFDRVVVETVGVGQSETEIADIADTTVLCLQPGAGDSLQFMKAGIVEVPDILVVNKADMETAARRTLADVEGALSLAPRASAWTPPVLAVSAARRRGIDDLIETLDRHAGWLRSGERLAERRAAQLAGWVRARVREDYGRVGLRRYEQSVQYDPLRPFATVAAAGRLFEDGESV